MRPEPRFSYNKCCSLFVQFSHPCLRDIVEMLIFAVGNYNDHNIKSSKHLAYMQIGHQSPLEMPIGRATEFGHLGGRAMAEVSVGKGRTAEVMPKQPISLTLRRLGVGECVTFPYEQRSSVISIMSRIRKEMARYGWQCSYEDLEEEFLVKVTRIR